MPGTVRPNKKWARLVYRMLNIPKTLQQHTSCKPSRNRIREWDKTSAGSR